MKEAPVLKVLSIGSNEHALPRAHAGVEFKFSCASSILTWTLLLLFCPWRYDIALINCSNRSAQIAGFLHLLWCGFFPKIVYLDPVISKKLTPLKRILLKKVHLYLNYFSEVSGWAALHQLDVHKMEFVPFKANLYDRETTPSTGVGIVVAGRSFRDYQCVIEAFNSAEWKASVVIDAQEGWNHGSSQLNFPEHLKVIYSEPGVAAWIELLAEFDVVLIPIQKEVLHASGISVALDAMLLNKVVIISDTPGLRDLPDDTVFRYRAGDPESLRKVLSLLHSDPALVASVRAQGKKYADSLGGEKALFLRVAEKIAKLV